MRTAEKPGGGVVTGAGRVFVALLRCEPGQPDGTRWHRGLLVNGSDRPLQEFEITIAAQLDMTSGPYDVGATRKQLGQLDPGASVEILAPGEAAADLCLELVVTAAGDGSPRRWTFTVWWDQPRYAPALATPIPELGTEGWVFEGEALDHA